MPPTEWQGHPTHEQVEEFRAKQSVAAEDAAEKAKQFYTLYPGHPKASDARKKEVEMLKIAEQLGSTNKSARLAALEEELLKDPKLSEDQRFKLRMDAVQRSVMGKQHQGEAAMLAAQEEGARGLIKDFPRRDEIGRASCRERV